jgi:hypothetical protein
MFFRNDFMDDFAGSNLGVLARFLPNIRRKGCVLGNAQGPRMIVIFTFYLLVTFFVVSRMPHYALHTV